MPTGAERTAPRAYMAACLRALGDAPTGQGRATCTSVALRLYGLCKAGRLDPADVTGRIKRVMIDRGWDPDEAARGMTLADINRNSTGRGRTPQHGTCRR